MTILWQKRVNGTLYEVRSAGKTRRLYTNGVLHSQYNPDQVITGSVWDLLMLPTMCVQEDKIKRVLVLGVGGGAVMHLLHTLLPPDIMIGIELSDQHIRMAKRFFSLNQPSVVLHHADAISWLQHYQGPAFDLIIDDLYGDGGGEPQRAVPLSKTWVKQLLSHLTTDGIMVVNTVSKEELNASSLLSGGLMEQHFKSAIRFSTPHCYNAVGAFFKSTTTLSVLRKRIVDTPILEKAERKGLLKYTAQQLM